MLQARFLFFIFLLRTIIIGGNVESCTITQDDLENITIECNYQIPKLTNFTTKKINFLKVTNLTHNIDGNTFRGLNNTVNLIINKGDRVWITSNAFKHLGTLKTLSLVSLGISTLLPSTFDDLIYLELLNLHGNQLESIPDGLFDHLAALRTLDLSNNRLRSITAHHLQNLVNLENLNLVGNSNLTMVRNALSNNKNVDISVDRSLCEKENSSYLCFREGKQLSPRGNQNYNQMEEDQTETSTVRITTKDYNSFQKYDQKDEEFDTNTTTTTTTTQSASNKSKVKFLYVTENESSKWRIEWAAQDGIQLKSWKVCWGINENELTKTCQLANNNSFTIDKSSLTSRKAYGICITGHLLSKCENSSDCYCKTIFLNGENINKSLTFALIGGFVPLFIVIIIFIVLAYNRNMSLPSKKKNRYSIEMVENTAATSQNYSLLVQQQDVQTI